MNSLLNSVLLGDLQVQNVPKDSIMEFIKGTEMDLSSLSNFQCNIAHSNESNLDQFNTGFGNQNDLHYQDECQIHEAQIPLYKQNYLREFKTEEEKAAARHALGLYNKGDVVAMSMLTAEDDIPSQQLWDEATLKQLRKGDQFFTPLTSFKAVYNSEGDTLEYKITKIEATLKQQNQKLHNILEVSQDDVITSLGDIQQFLKGFKNGDTLNKTITDLDHQMLRFEKTGDI